MSEQQKTQAGAGTDEGKNATGPEDISNISDISNDQLEKVVGGTGGYKPHLAEGD